MIDSKIDSQLNPDCVEIDEALIDIITDKIIAEMTYYIKNIDPSEDTSAEYSEYWTTGTYESEGFVKLDEPNDKYDIVFEYELSWQYREWDEYWTDPVCYPTFDEMRNETGNIINLEIYTPSGDKVKQEICNTISDKVNNKIKSK